MKIFIDSDILIWHLRGEKKATAFLNQVQKTGELWIGAMQRAEIVFFMKPAEEISTLNFLNNFTTAEVTQKIIDQAGIIWRSYNKSHGTDINDAILASTAIVHQARIYTQNIKHYPLKNLKIEKGW